MTQNALERLTHRIATATSDQIDAAMTCLRLGAGWLGDGANGVPTGPSGLEPSRRWLWIACAEAIGSENWAPVRVGAWEPVLATLILEGDWSAIAQTADELRREEATS